MDLKYKLLVLLIVSVIGVAKSQVADQCTATNCLPPDCRCATENLNAGIPFDQIPQLVMITFDAAVTAQIYDMVIPVLEGRRNPDGCPVAITYFVSHEYTDYSKVNSLWANGHEIGLNSISHAVSLDYWRTISMENLTAEFGDQISLISHFAQIDSNDIYGIRIPSFQLSGDNTFKIISELDLLYDSTWPTQLFSRGLWPYTLDYRSSQDCPTGSCPTGSIPGVWVIPNIMWEDTLGYKCSMIDACINIPSDDLEALVDWMKSNFIRIYNTTKAPFPIYLHGAWFLRHENHIAAYEIFLDYLDSLPDVYFVSKNRVIEYVRNPRPIGNGGISTDEPTVAPTDEPTVAPTVEPTDEPTDFSTTGEIYTTTDHTTTTYDYPISTGTDEQGTTGWGKKQLVDRIESYQIFDQCQAVRPSSCLARLCRLVREDTGEERYMNSCVNCPSVFPWKNNPLGHETK